MVSYDWQGVIVMLVISLSVLMFAEVEIAFPKCSSSSIKAD